MHVSQDGSNCAHEKKYKTHGLIEVLDKIVNARDSVHVSFKLEMICTIPINSPSDISLYC